ncbi:hypothetical protein [Streptomyces sp. 049-1]|uniref:hypothetical protein n=1 Tax=Streptomyces sp. 049-1 TaxID=2789264 RepID=UPI003980F835
MISFAQVIAALAAGGLLTIAIVLVIERYSDVPHRSKTPVLDEEAERERRIEAARSIAVGAVETFRQQAVNGSTSGPPADRPAVSRDPSAVRSKRHLTLFLGGSVAALAWLATAARETMREHRGQLMGATLGAAATATAVTTLTLTPWSADTDNDAERPPLGPTAPPWRTPSPPAPLLPEAPDSSPAAPPSSVAPALSQDPASPSASPTPPAAPPAAATGPGHSGSPTPTPSDSSSPSSSPTGTATGLPPDGDAPPVDEPPGKPEVPADEDLCVSTGLEPLLHIGVCLSGS